MQLSEIENGKYYEFKVGKKIIPIYVQDVIPSGGVVAKNMNTQREVFIKNAAQIIRLIESLSEWRLTIVTEQEIQEYWDQLCIRHIEDAISQAGIEWSDASNMGWQAYSEEQKVKLRPYVSQRLLELELLSIATDSRIAPIER